jgi:replicative DNA helicase
MVRALDDGMVDMGAEQRLKVPPNSIEAEQSLIGGLMLDALAWDKVADVIISDDFYRQDVMLSRFQNTSTAAVNWRKSADSSI